jgi:menaquinol-cytochrome c reductase iron-sulfur subunit
MAGVVGLLGGIVAAVIGLPAVGYILAPALKKTASDEWVGLGPLENIPAEPTLFTFTRVKQIGWERNAASYGAYVIRAGDGSLSVLSNVCTHLACRVAWKDENGDFTCPCHDGHFAVDGTVLSGPPPRPLDRFEHKVDEAGTLSIHLVEG